MSECKASEVLTLEAPAPRPPSFPLRVRSLAGDELAALGDALGGWSVRDVEERLPPVLPGHRYKLMQGEKVLEGTATLDEMLPQLGKEDSWISAVVTKTENAQEEMDMALVGAAEELDADRVRALVAAGASAAFVHDPPGTWGAQDKKSALHMAVSSNRQGGSGRRAVIESLIGANADVNAMRTYSDWRGCGSSSSAFEMVLPRALEDAALLKLFLDAGADPNTTSVRNVHSMRTDGRSVSCVLHKAVRMQHVEIARAFLDAGAEVDAVASEHFENERGFNRHMDETGLHIACSQGNVPMVALLLQHGADINKVREDLEQEERKLGFEQTTDDPRDPDFEPKVTCVPIEETALHIAIGKKHTSLVAFLVCAGADTSRARVRGGVKSAPQALCGDDVKMAEALKAQWSPAVREQFEEDVRAVVEAVVASARDK